MSPIIKYCFILVLGLVVGLGGEEYVHHIYPQPTSSASLQTVDVVWRQSSSGPVLNPDTVTLKIGQTVLIHGFPSSMTSGNLLELDDNNSHTFEILNTTPTSISFHAVRDGSGTVYIDAKSNCTSQMVCPAFGISLGALNYTVVN